MDKLSITAFILLFIFSGAGLPSLLLLSLLGTGKIALNYLNLFSLINLLTYYFYGFFGMIYLFISSLALMVCGFMYWYELSIDEFKKEAEEMRIKALNDSETIKPDVPANVTGVTMTNEVTKTKLDVQLERAKVFFDKYKGLCFDFLEKKLGFTSKRMEKISNVYTKISSYYDNFVAMVYNFLLKFKNATKNVVGLRSLYYLDDQLVICRDSVNSLRTMHKAARDMQIEQNNIFMKMQDQLQSLEQIQSLEQLQSQEQSQFLEQNRTPKSSGDSKDKITDLDKLPSRSNTSKFASFEELEKMQKQMESISPQDKQNMDELALQLFGNMKLNDMVNMMGGLGAMSNANNINTNTSNNSNNKSKKK
jgi:hypothetical protein